MRISDLVTKVVGDKRRWRQYKARVAQLPRTTAPRRRASNATSCTPAGCRTARPRCGCSRTSPTCSSRAAANDSSVRAVVGDDPVEFVEAFIRNYDEGSWPQGAGALGQGDRRRRGGRSGGLAMTTPAASAPVIRVQGLEKSYQELEVLRGVDFEVERGSIFALLGSNGAGKTTVVRILSTLLRSDAGTAIVNGFDVAAQPAKVRSPSASRDSLPPSTTSSAGGRTSCWRPVAAPQGPGHDRG